LDGPSRGEQDLERQALRNDWPMPPAVRRRVLQRLLDYLDPETPEGAVASERTVGIMGRTIAQFARLTLGQQRLDLDREKHEGKKSDVPFADVVKAAEERYEARKRER
jgi:hypothetical protein